MLLVQLSYWVLGVKYMTRLFGDEGMNSIISHGPLHHSAHSI